MKMMMMTNGDNEVNVAQDDENRKQNKETKETKLQDSLKLSITYICDKHQRAIQAQNNHSQLPRNA